MSALIPLSLAVTLGVTPLGCSGEFPSDNAPLNEAANDAADNALIESHLAGRGYDTSNLEFEGDKVIVEGDMVMPREPLLAQAEAEASGVVEKGYFNPTNARFAGNQIRLAFKSADANFPAVSQAWKNAFIAAVAEWNNKTPGFKTLAAPLNPRTITVRMGSINVSQPARADGFPPALGIQLNTRYNLSTCATSIEAVPTNVKINIALHEIGHILGFEHPPPLLGSDGRVHIAGTATSTATTGDTSSYATVMESRCLADTTLRPDDVLSAGKKYPAPTCQQICEFNCTFNVDPAQIGLCQASCPQQCGG